MPERDVPLKPSAQLDRMAEDVLTKFGDYGEYTRLRQDARIARQEEVAAQAETSTPDPSF